MCALTVLTVKITYMGRFFQIVLWPVTLLCLVLSLYLV